MKVVRLFSVISIMLTGMCTVSLGNDSTVTATPDSLKSPATLTVADSITISDTFVSFSVQQKMYLRKCIIANVLYLGGFAIYKGIAFPRLKKAGNGMEVLKLLPLTYLAGGMMYASHPICMVSSRRAKKNYEYYYKTAPRKFTLPLTLTGVGLILGSSYGILWQKFLDYRDNNEIDGSYNKYEKLTDGLYTAGLITFAGSNLYSLIYTVILGEKAKHLSANPTASLQLAPMRYGDANGCMLTWNF